MIYVFCSLILLLFITFTIHVVSYSTAIHLVTISDVKISKLIANGAKYSMGQGVHRWSFIFKIFSLFCRFNKQIKKHQTLANMYSLCLIKMMISFILKYDFRILKNFTHNSFEPYVLCPLRKFLREKNYMINSINYTEIMSLNISEEESKHLDILLFYLISEMSIFSLKTMLDKKSSSLIKLSNISLIRNCYDSIIYLFAAKSNFDNKIIYANIYKAWTIYNSNSVFQHDDVLMIADGACNVKRFVNGDECILSACGFGVNFSEYVTRNELTYSFIREDCKKHFTNDICNMDFNYNGGVEEHIYYGLQEGDIITLSRIITGKAQIQKNDLYINCGEFLIKTKGLAIKEIITSYTECTMIIVSFSVTETNASIKFVYSEPIENYQLSGLLLDKNLIEFDKFLQGKLVAQNGNICVLDSFVNSQTKSYYNNALEYIEENISGYRPFMLDWMFYPANLNDNISYTNMWCSEKLYIEGVISILKFNKDGNDIYKLNSSGNKSITLSINDLFCFKKVKKDIVVLSKINNKIHFLKIYGVDIVNCCENSIIVSKFECAYLVLSNTKIIQKLDLDFKSYSPPYKIKTSLLKYNIILNKLWFDIFSYDDEKCQICALSVLNYFEPNNVKEYLTVIFKNFYMELNMQLIVVKNCIEYILLSGEAEFLQYKFDGVKIFDKILSVLNEVYKNEVDSNIFSLKLFICCAVNLLSFVDNNNVKLDMINKVEHLKSIIGWSYKDVENFQKNYLLDYCSYSHINSDNFLSEISKIYEEGKHCPPIVAIAFLKYFISTILGIKIIDKAIYFKTNLPNVIEDCSVQITIYGAEYHIVMIKNGKQETKLEGITLNNTGVPITKGKVRNIEVYY